jgi:hypothetical protein
MGPLLATLMDLALKAVKQSLWHLQLTRGAPPLPPPNGSVYVPSVP